jgi:hypothetical protein
LANLQARKCEMEQRTVVRFLTRKSLKAKEIEMELTNVYGNEVFLISAIKKWRTCFLQETRELGNGPRSGRPTNSDFPQVIAELIRERPFLSCTILCRHLRVSKDTYLRLLQKKLGLKGFIYGGFYTMSLRIEHENLKSCHATSAS